MNADAVHAILDGAGGVRGETCADIPEQLQFRRCCGSDDRDYQCEEYIARGPGGGVYYLSLNQTPNRNGDRVITFGPKGYHYRNGSNPCV